MVDLLPDLVKKELELLFDNFGVQSAAEMSRLIRWHERTVSRYQHTAWADVVASALVGTTRRIARWRWRC